MLHCDGVFEADIEIEIPARNKHGEEVSNPASQLMSQDDLQETILNTVHATKTGACAERAQQ